MKARNLTVIHWSDEGDAYVARVPALDGCISHGASYEEAARNVAEVIDAWLASAERHGDPIPDADAVAVELRRLRPLLNLSKLAKEAGLNHHTLASKLPRGTKLTAAGAKSAGRVLATVCIPRGGVLRGLKPRPAAGGGGHGRLEEVGGR